MENIGQKRNCNHGLDESSNQIVFSEGKKKISHKKTIASVREGHNRIRSIIKETRQCREVAEVERGASGRDVRTDKEWQLEAFSYSNGIRLEIEKEIQWGRMRTVSVLNSCENYTRREKRTKESQHIHN